MKGWGDQRGDYRKAKARIVEQLTKLDNLAELGLVNEDLWAHRYKLELKMEKLFAEESYWQQRGGEYWVLKGDTNISFFHMVTNGRRKKTIVSLEHLGETITDQDMIRR